MKKRILSVLLTLVMLIGLVSVMSISASADTVTYDLWIGGVQVTSANKDNIVVPGATGSASFDPDTKTLTLNNFSYTGLGYNHYHYYDEDYGEHYYSYAAIYSKNKLIIKLVGNNTVFCEGEGAGLPSFCGVYTEEYGDLTICDDTTDNAIGSFSANRISSYGNLTIRDVNVTAQYRLNALYSAGDLWIQNATVMATAESGAITCYGDITMEDSIVTATSTNTGEYDRGIFHRDTLTVKNSIVEMIGGKASESFSASTLIPTLEFDIPFVVLAGADKASAVTADSSVDATYTGKYVKITPIYKVTFDYGSFGNETVTVFHNETVTPPTPVFAGTVLVGWYTDSNFTTEFNFSNAITNTTTTIYAKFTAAVAKIDKTATSGLVDTYTITYTDGTTTTFTVTNGEKGDKGDQGIQGIQGVPGADGHTPVITIQDGYWYIDGVNTNQAAQGVKGDTGNGISDISKTGTNGLVDTYTITYTDGTTTTFTVTNGEKGDKGNTGAAGADGVGIAKIEKTSSDGNVDTYTITLTNGTTYTFTVTNGTNGTDGKDGKDGVDGKDGTNGTNGVDGKDGAIVAATAVGGTALISNIALIAWTLIKKKRLF